MRIMRNCVLLFTAMGPLASYSLVNGQAALEKPDQFAIVFFYRLKEWPDRYEFLLVVDGADLARMHSGRYLAIKLEPGKHTFRTEDMEDGVSLDLEGGKEYYFELKSHLGLMTRRGKLTVPDSALGKAISENLDKAKLKQLAADKIKDSSKVIGNYAELKKASK